MAYSYEWDENPIQDVLINSLMYETDISTEEFKKELNGVLILLLESYMKNKGDLIYLDYEIKKTKDSYKIVGNNILTCLWFLGIAIENPMLILKNNECVVGDIVYTFNEKTKTLKYKFI